MKLLLVCSLLLRISSFQSSEAPSSRAPRNTYTSSHEVDEDQVDDPFQPLQIPCEINGYIIPAIVDTGAQITVMSESCARRCRVSNMIDSRFCGKAVGMGTSDILGRISELPMRVGPISYHNKVSILRESRVDLILGLDFLRRFKSEINLEDGILRMKVRGKVIRIAFIDNYERPLRSSSDSIDQSEDNVTLEDEGSSSEDESMYGRDQGESRSIREKMPMRGGFSDRPTPRSSRSDEAYDEESDEEVHRYKGVSMEGV